MCNLKGTPGTHLPLQASVDKLAATLEAMKKTGIAAPLPVLDLKDFLPPWAKEVSPHVAFRGISLYADSRQVKRVRNNTPQVDKENVDPAVRHMAAAITESLGEGSKEELRRLDMMR